MVVLDLLAVAAAAVAVEVEHWMMRGEGMALSIVE